jgi:hypothetical protein
MRQNRTKRARGPSLHNSSLCHQAPAVLSTWLGSDAARDTFEAAITLAENQIGGYAGLAAMYGLIGKTAEADKYARLGLSELAKMRETPAGRALRHSTIFPADFDDQTERHLRTFLANK